MIQKKKVMTICEEMFLLELDKKKEEEAYCVPYLDVGAYSLRGASLSLSFFFMTMSAFSYFVNTDNHCTCRR